MRIAGQTLTAGNAAPVQGATVTVARQGTRAALATLMTDAKGMFETELNDDHLAEPVLVFTATREGFQAAHLERKPVPEMQVVLGLAPAGVTRQPVTSPPAPAGLWRRVPAHLLPAAALLAAHAVCEALITFVVWNGGRGVKWEAVINGALINLLAVPLMWPALAACLAFRSGPPAAPAPAGRDTTA